MNTDKQSFTHDSRAAVWICGLFLICVASAFGQPKFEVADVHPSAPGSTPFMRGPMRHGVRFELLNGSLADLISYAYGVDSDKVLGGPNWLEFDRFDVIAKVAPNAQPEAMQDMVQSLLADRFKLALHTDTKPFPGYALTAGKNVKLKDADGTGMTGCQMRVMMSGPPAGDGAASGPPNVTFDNTCHSVTMTIFANSLVGWIGPQTPNSSSPPIVDKTELKGTYDIELKLTGNMGDISEATVIGTLDKELGLKIEPIQVPMQVITVESANRKPTPNSPDVAAAFPPPPGEFEVASLKPSAPTPADGGRGGRGGRGAQYQNDRVTMQNATLHQLINVAWNLTPRDTIVDLPKFADTDHYDLMAKVPASVANVSTPGGGRGGPVDLDLYRPMFQKLLTDRFQLKVHFEDRPADAYVLTAGKPKLQKADPAKRTRWEDGPGPDAKDPRKGNVALGRLVHCQNMSMAEFAALLPSIAPGYQLGHVEDKTGLEGSWDFTLNFSGANFDGGRGGAVQFGGDRVMISVARPTGGDSGTASDPSGGLSLFDAIGKELGLKLELQKRPMPMLVIDHMEPKPTEN